MAFTYQGTLHGGSSETYISYEAVSSATIGEGALVAKAIGAATVSIKANTTTQAVYGISKKSITSTDTGAEIALLPTGSIVDADIDEISNAITASAGSATTFASAALVGLGDDVLIGSQWIIASKAAASSQVGNVLTITDFTSSSGTLTFATTTSLFATGDTLTLKNLGLPSTKVWYGNTSSLPTTAFNRSFVSNPYPIGLYKLAVNTAGTAVKLSIANTPMNFFKVIGTNADGTKVRLAVMNGVDACAVLATT